MTRKIIRGLWAVTIILVCMSVYLSATASIDAYNKEQAKNYDYHFQVIVDKNLDKNNKEKLIEGINKAGLENNVFIEIIESIDKESKKEIIDKAIYAKVDGIVYSTESYDVEAKLGNKAKKVDIPMVNYNLTGDKHKDIVSIQATPEVLAKTIANNISDIVKKEKLSKKEKILVFLKECSDNDKRINNGIVKGFKKGISSKYKDNVKFLRVDAEGYDVNSKLKSQIKKNKKEKIVVCFDKQYTNVASAIYTNEYKKSKVRVVGFGATDNNKKSLESNTISKLFNVKYESLGYNSVNILCDMKKNSKVECNKYIPLLQMMKMDSDNNVTNVDLVVNSTK